MLQESLKRCPFCHAKPVVQKYPLWHGSHGYYGNYEYYVSCQNEKCKIAPRTKSYIDLYDMKEQECIYKAIQDWNTRR